MATTHIYPPMEDWLLGWTEEKVKAYVESRPLAAGDKMLIVNQYGGFRTYELVQVENPSLGRQRRVLVSMHQQLGGQTFYRSGKNCFQPKGQTKMIPPTSCLEPYLKELGDRVEVNGRYGVTAAPRASSKDGEH